jgi:hypothetical protein
MIAVYLEQIPPLIAAMKQAWQDKNWNLLHGAAHKMIPSFSIMGMSSDFEMMAKKVQEYASLHQQSDGIYELVLQLEKVCTQACNELEVEMKRIKKIEL